MARWRGAHAMRGVLGSAHVVRHQPPRGVARRRYGVTSTTPMLCVTQVLHPRPHAHMAGGGEAVERSANQRPRAGVKACASVGGGAPAGLYRLCGCTRAWAHVVRYWQTARPKRALSSRARLRTLPCVWAAAIGWCGASAALSGAVGLSPCPLHSRASSQSVRACLSSLRTACRAQGCARAQVLTGARRVALAVL